MGLPFFRSFYIIYDYDTLSIGIAQSKLSASGTLIPEGKDSEIIVFIVLIVSLTLIALTLTYLLCKRKNLVDKKSFVNN